MNKNEIIIKNGVAGVEINGRFYTHECADGYFWRIIDISSPHEEHSWAACVDCSGVGEYVELVFDTEISPIPNPALEWPAGTRVLVRNSDVGRWVERAFHCVDSEDILCISQRDKRYVEGWEQCKLAEGGE